MIKIDGRQGEGGGQVLRSALAFSALTGRSFEIRRIRGGRPRPGLRPQHLAAVRLAASLCGAQVQGDAVNSTELTFVPGDIRPGFHRIEVGTAGSVTLLGQAVLVPALCSLEPMEFELIGGTDVPKAPPVDYLLEVVLPHFRRLGSVEGEVVRRGFHPKGEGCLRLRVHGHGLGDPLVLEHPPKWTGFHARVAVSQALQEANVGERIARALGTRFEQGCEVEYTPTADKGAVATLWAQDERGVTMGAGCLGRPRLSSEKLASIALREFERCLAEEAPVEEHLADQLVPLLALVGGKLRCQTISRHCLTNIHICGLFCDREFSVSGNLVCA